MNAGSALGPAFQHMMRVLFRPFALKTWLGLGFVSALAYGGGGGFTFNVPSPGGSGGPDQQMPRELQTALTWAEHHIMLLVAIGVVLLLISFLFAWLSSVFKFVYTEQVIRGNGAIREPFARLKGLGTSFFLWELGFGAVALVTLGALVGLPILTVFVLVHKAGLGAKITVCVVAGLIGLVLIIAFAITALLARNFVVAAMYVRGLRVMDAWRVVMPTLRANVGPLVLYLLLLFVLGIGIGIATIIAVLLVMVVLAIPVGLIALIVYLIFTGAHLHWTPVVIGVIGSLAFVVMLACVYVIQCAVQPAMVFLRAYSLVVLGQADPTLATIPAGTIPTYAGPQPAAE